MIYCYECGSKLIEKECSGEEHLIPYCPHCNAYRFPIFSTAISTVVLNPNADKVLLIQQYGKTRNILVAGYVNKGENAETALVREVQEEVHLNIVKYKFMASRYFGKSNTLMLNFTSQANSEDISHINTIEVDKAGWYTFDEAKNAIAPASLAEEFLLLNLERMQKGEF